MKKIKWINRIAVALISVSIISCVPAKVHHELEDKYNNCDKQSKACQTKVDELEEDNTQLTNSLNKANARMKDMEVEVKGLTVARDTLSNALMKLKTDYVSMLGQYSEQLSGSHSEKNQLSTELSKREIELKNKELEMKAKGDSLNAMQLKIDEKEKRIKEIQEILNKKEQETALLKEKMTKALMGFQGNGLTVHTKNGKVYVSVEEKLLFASGSWTVAPEGQKAIKEIALVLEKNTDIDVMVEGHTDNVPYKGTTGIRDNWDLSVMRATSIVKIMLESAKVAPNRVMAAGRGEFMPIAPNDTKENKAKNRRTEIILTPKLDEVFELLNK